MRNIPVQFSKSELDYLYACQSCWFNEAEGGKRAGKNVINVMAFCRELETHPNRLHLVGGYTQGTASINVLDCDGFGVFNYFHGRYKEGKFEGKNAVYIRTKTGEKIILIVGMGKNGSEADFKGYTIGMCYLTEINEMAQTPVQEAFDRTLSSKRRKIFMDLNPKAPNHWFYKDIESIHRKKDKARDEEILQALNEGRKEIPKKYGFNYGHFTIADNMSMSDEQIREVLNTYDKESLYFKRDILGNRICLNGLCFPQLAEHIKEFVIKSDDARLMRISKVRIGCDYGGSLSAHTFVCTAITMRNEVIVLASRRIMAKGITPVQLTDMYCNFVLEMYSRWGFAITSRCDSAEQTLINGFRTESAKRQLPNEVRNAMKTSINDRISLTNTLAAQHRLFFLEGETNTLQDALCNAVWDDKEAEKGNDVRLDNNTSDIDSLDAYEYTIEEDRRSLIQFNQTH